MTGNPEVIGSSAGLVPRNALVLTGLANFRMVGHQEVIQRDLFHHLAETLGLGFSAWADQRVLRAVDSGAGFNFRMARQT